MARVLKYQVSFEDIAGVAWLIYFDEEDWGGAVTSLTPGANPLTIRWIQNKKYQPIIGSVADIQLVYESAVDELYTEESQDIRVTAYKSGTLFWQGFVSPGQYQRNFNKPVAIVTLTASDGLGELKHEKFVDGNSDPYYYSTKEINVITTILLKTGLSTTVYDAINVFEDGYDATAADSPLAQTYIWPEQYWDEVTDERGDCYTVLSDILKKYGATVRYSYGHWYLLRPNDFSVHDDIYYRVFTTLGNYDSNADYPANLVMGDNTSLMFYVHANQELTKLVPYGGAEVKVDLKERINTLKNGSFNDFTWEEGEPLYWTNSGATYNNTADTEAITFASNESSSVPSNYLTARVWLYRARSVRLTFEYKCAYTGSPTHAKIHIGLVFAGGSYFAPIADVWYSSSYPTTSSLAYDLIADSKASMTDYETLIVEPSRGPWDATEGGYGHFSYLDVRLYEFHNETSPMGGGNYVAYRHVFLEVDQDGTLPRQKIHIFDGSSTVKNIFRETLNLADSYLWLDYALSYDDIFYGVTQDTPGGSYNETHEWYIKGHNVTATTPEPIAELLGRQVVEGHSRSLDVLSGSIRSSYHQVPHRAIEDANMKDSYGFEKRFFPMGISYDVRNNIWKGSWVDCPAVYTDSGMEWDSHDCGGSAVMTANEIEVNSWTNPGGAVDFAYFDDLTAVAGQTSRLVLELTDDGSSALPRFMINGSSQARAWGTNYYTAYFSSAGVQTFELNDQTGGSTFNFTATLTLYYIEGV